MEKKIFKGRGDEMGIAGTDEANSAGKKGAVVELSCAWGNRGIVWDEINGRDGSGKGGERTLRSDDWEKYITVWEQIA